MWYEVGDTGLDTARRLAAVSKITENPTSGKFLYADESKMR